MDEHNHITEIGLPNRTSPFYAYDEDKNLVSYTDSEGRVTAYQYDGENRVVKQTDISTPSPSRTG